VKKVSWLEREKRRRQKAGKGGGWPADDGNDTSGTSFVHMEAWIPGEPGLWVARSPLSPWGGCFLDAEPPPTPKQTSYNCPFVFCRNLKLRSRYEAQGKAPRRMRSSSMLPHCREGETARPQKALARPLQRGLELCSLRGDRQPGPFPQPSLRALSPPWQQPRRPQAPQTAGRTQVMETHTPASSPGARPEEPPGSPSPGREQRSELPADLAKR